MNTTKHDSTATKQQQTARQDDIQQTIRKQAGHGPYLWCVIWQAKDRVTDGPYSTVFSFWDDAIEFSNSIVANGNLVRNIDLAVDRTRKVHDDETVAAALVNPNGAIAQMARVFLDAVHGIDADEISGDDDRAKKQRTEFVQAVRTARQITKARGGR